MVLVDLVFLRQTLEQLVATAIIKNEEL